MSSPSKIQIHVATSPITNIIYAGRLCRDGETWAGNPVNVTGEAAAAVAQHVVAAGGISTVRENGVARWTIRVDEIPARRLPVNPQVKLRQALARCRALLADAATELRDPCDPMVLKLRAATDQIESVLSGSKTDPADACPTLG